MLIVLFLVSHFNFLFVPCGGLSWLPVSFLLHVKYTLSYRIVSYRITGSLLLCLPTGRGTVFGSIMLWGLTVGYVDKPVPT